MGTSTPQDHASSATSIGEALQRFEDEGFTTQFGVTDDSAVQCFGCREPSAASDVELHGLIRTEGASDPDDMTAVAALECPRCHAKGTVVLKYGPESPIEESDVLRTLDDRRVATGVDPDRT